MSKLPSELACDLERSLPALASLGSSLSHSQSLTSHLIPPPPERRRAISDVRRTFCLFVTFDLLFISLLWIIELNVSWGHGGEAITCFLVHLLAAWEGRWASLIELI